MNPIDLAAEFRSLAKPVGQPNRLVFATLQIRGTMHRLGKDCEGAPALLIKVGSGRAERVPIVLQHLSVLPKVRCQIALLGEKETPEPETFTVVRCLSTDSSLRRYFIRVADAAAAELGPHPTTEAVNDLLRRLAELFRAFEAPPIRTAQGLWAELALISWALRPDDLCLAWHTEPTEGFDFSTGAERIEVKSFDGTLRVHSFSFAQVNPEPEMRVLIASLNVKRSSGGTSISDLLETIGQRLSSAEAVSRLELGVARALGDAAPNALPLSFDLQRARESVQFYDPIVVPAIRPPLPPGVLSVHFQSLLPEDAALSPSDVEHFSDLAAAARPQKP